jgi:protein-tyrosine phosphatase
MADRRRVLFVCMGNICRSPAAEGLFRAYVERRGMAEHIDVDSAGTLSYHAGEPADPRMCLAAAERGYELTGTARRVDRTDLDHFDLIVAMDRDNLDDLQSLAGGPQPHIRMLGSFIDGFDNRTALDVPDPYYGGPDGFERVLDLIESACPAILAAVAGEPRS